MYYCPRCDRTIPKDRVEEADRELRARFGVEKLSDLRCPVCNMEYIDLDKVKGGGRENVGKTRQSTGDG